MPSTIEHRVRILSVAPWFDDSTAHDLLSIAPGGGNVEETTASEFVSVLARSGLVSKRGGAWSVVEPLRTESRKLLQSEDGELFRSAVSVFSEHAANGLMASLVEVMGAHGAAVHVGVLEVLGEADSSEALDRLVELADRSPRERGVDALVAAKLLESYSGRRDRSSNFLRGLGDWQQGKKIAAAVSFELVDADFRPDKAGAVSAHLLAVNSYDSGHLTEAQEYAARALDVLQGNGDIRGLALTLTTFGRILREVYRETRDETSLEKAVDALKAAVEHGRYLSDWEIEGRAAAYLAQAYSESGQIDEAADAAQRAVHLLRHGEQAVHARTILASIRRKQLRAEESVDLLNEASSIVETESVGDRAAARLLNVRAAAERRAGRPSEAARLARESLALGRRLGDRRHVAHAAHTLASVYLDLLPASGGERDLRLTEVSSLLEEARAILAGLRNVDGVAKVENTFSRLEAAMASVDTG